MKNPITPGGAASAQSSTAARPLWALRVKLPSQH
jgi:hypothetical protein